MIASGALIGIKYCNYLSKGGGNNGYWALQFPVAMVKDVVEKLVADGKVTRGYLGVAIADLDNEYLQKFTKEKEGALVLDISAETPAAKRWSKKR